MNSLYILWYIKKKNLKFPISLQSGSNVFETDVESLGLQKGDALLVINQKDIRGKSLASIKSILDKIKDNASVSLTILRKNGDQKFQDKKSYPRIESSEIYGFCDRCPEGGQIQSYSKSVDWYTHVT